MKKIGLSLLMFFFLFSGIAVAALYEGSWNTNQIGAMPGGDTLRNGEYHQDWYGTVPELIGSETVWTSMGDSGTQFTIQGTRNWASTGSGWFAVEGTDTYYYQPSEATYVGDGHLLFDGDLYSGSGWTQVLKYTNKYLYSDSVFYYVGAGSMTVVGYGVFDSEPFDIYFSLTLQQDTFNLSELWDEGHSSYNEITISQVPIPAAFGLLASGLIGLVGIRRKFKK